VAPWQTTGTRSVYANAWIEVHEHDVVRPDGTAGLYGVVGIRQPAVFVVAVTDADEVVLVSLDRYTVGHSVEVPAGGTDGEAPLQAAQRELREETGLTAATWARIGGMHALNGVCRAPEHVFLATDLSHHLSRTGSPAAGADLDAEGISEVRTVPFEQVLRMIADGDITDGETIAALMFAAIHLGRVS
jgi:8-oxo-dGTP pyrophosphatase MutT (NUDIX family)